MHNCQPQNHGKCTKNLLETEISWHFMMIKSENQLTLLAMLAVTGHHGELL